MAQLDMRSGAGLKILMTHERFAPDFAGGGEYVVLETARSLIRRGVDVQVLTTGIPSIGCYEGIPTKRLPIHRYRMNFAADKIAEAASARDLILTFNYHACLASLAAGRKTQKPVVCTIMGLYQKAWKEMKGFVLGGLWMLLERYQVTRAFDRLLFPSKESLELAVRLGASRARSVVNFPGIEWPPDDLKVEREDIVLFSGKFDVRKGILDIFEVARRLPRVRFRMVAWGNQESNFRKIAPSNVEFAAFERGRSLQEAFARARIFFLPSHAETFGLALVEAMAAGCAVVSTLPLEFRGVRTEIGDCDAMTEAVSSLWEDRELCRRWGGENRELARQYTWERNTDVVLGVCREVLGHSR
jgi:glycosyltransferase involved in cell wall biosynthesis